MANSATIVGLAIAVGTGLLILKNIRISERNVGVGYEWRVHDAPFKFLPQTPDLPRPARIPTAHSLAAERIWTDHRALPQRGLSDTLIDSAQAGHAPSQIALGSAFLRGDGVPIDHRQAVSWFKKAARQGDPVALFNLGQMYETGTGVRGDGDMALRLFRESAQLGYPNARHKLASYGYR